MSVYRDVRTANIFFCEKLKSRVPYTTCMKRHQIRGAGIGEPPLYPFCFNCEEGEKNLLNKRMLGLVKCDCCGRPKRIRHYFNQRPVCSTCYVYCKEAKSKNYSFKEVSDFMKGLIEQYGDSLSQALRRKEITLLWKMPKEEIKTEEEKPKTEKIDISPKDIKFEDLFDEVVIINGTLLTWLAEEMKGTEHGSVEDFVISILNNIKESNSPIL